MIVLGIDPGVANTGYGIVAHDRGRLVALDGGVIETAAGTDAGARLAHIHARVGELLDAYRPDAVAVEDLYFGTNARSAFAVGQARGVVILAAGQRGDPLRVLHAPAGQDRGLRLRPRRQSTRSSGWSRRCSRFPTLPTPDHAADALAVAICHANGAPMAGRAGEGRRMIALVSRRGRGPPRRSRGRLRGGVGYRLAVSAETLRHVPARGRDRRRSSRT